MKIKDFAVAAVFIGILSALGIGSLILPDSDISASERRYLTQYASYTEKEQEAAQKGQSYTLSDYFSYLEAYALDQFPGRDMFRSIKSLFKQNVLLQRDNNGYYCVDGSLSRMEDTLNETAVSDALSCLNDVYENFFQAIGADTYFCIVPDKNYFLAGENGYLHYDYASLYQIAADTMDGNIHEIDIRGCLTAQSYYRTDPHWDQTALLSVAETILQSMGAGGGIADLDWQTHILEPFYGTYYGQMALPIAPDTLGYLTCPQTENVTVYNYAAEEYTTLYQVEKFSNIDPYDVFLGGAVPLLKLSNPDAAMDKQLVVFRDSFGSSLIPLLSPAYSEIIVVDIRYISPSSLSAFIRFQPGCDVLFLYATTVLNTYGAFMK